MRGVLLKALWCLIPVCSNALRCELNLLVALVYDLAEAKICNLDLPTVEYYILWLQVKMNDLLFALIQVLQPTEYL